MTQFPWWISCSVALVLGCAGCAALSDDMQRAQTAFEAARYEDVETWLLTLEPDLADMDRGLRVRFYYLRGTTAFRLSKPGVARHYLALARVELEHEPHAIRPAWREELTRMLQQLDAPGALTNG